MIACTAIFVTCGNPVSAEILFSTDFSTDGGFVSGNAGAESPWVYTPGAWSVDGSTNLGSPSSSTLTSPLVVVGETGMVRVSFGHVYSFEYDTVTRWDGGAVFASINGGGFNHVAGSSFNQNGYIGTITGNNLLNGLEAFNGVSPSGDRAPGGPAPQFITSEFQLALNAGDTLQVQFVGAWDEFAQGDLPNWEISQLAISDSAEAAGIPSLSVAGLALLIVLISGVAIVGIRRLA